MDTESTTSRILCILDILIGCALAVIVAATGLRLLTEYADCHRKEWEGGTGSTQEKTEMILTNMESDFILENAQDRSGLNVTLASGKIL